MNYHIWVLMKYIIFFMQQFRCINAILSLILKYTLLNLSKAYFQLDGLDGSIKILINKI